MGAAVLIPEWIDAPASELRACDLCLHGCGPQGDRQCTHPEATYRQPIQILRDALKMAECLGSASTMREIRRKIRAIERGQDPDAPRIDTPADRRPRKRVTWSRPARRQGYFFVRLTCGHRLDVKAVSDRHGLKRALHRDLHHLQPASLSGPFLPGAVFASPLGGAFFLCHQKEKAPKGLS